MSFIDLRIEEQKLILDNLKEMYDQVTIDKSTEFIMEILYGTEYIMESFYIPSYLYNKGRNHLELFEKNKLRLFMNGVRLYKRTSLKSFELICDVEDEYWNSIR